MKYCSAERREFVIARRKDEAIQGEASTEAGLLSIASLARNDED